MTREPHPTAGLNPDNPGPGSTPVPTYAVSGAHLDSTRASLLSRIKDPGDATGWQRFFDTYASLIHSSALKAGCSTTEADDVLQEVLLSVAREIPDFKYDPAKGTFKSWLFRIVSRRVVDLFRRRRVGDARRVDSAVLQDDMDLLYPSLELGWEEQWREHQLARACDKVKAEVSPRQWQMFELFVLHGWPMDRITGFLCVNRAQVYMAKMRVGRLMKQAVETVASEPF